MCGLYKTLFENKKNKVYTGVIGFIILGCLIAAVFHYESGAIPTRDASKVLAEVEAAALAEAVELVETTATKGPFSGHADEDSETTKEVSILEGNIISLTATLSWVDEEPPRLFTNEPDSFTLTISSPLADKLSSEPSTTGSITLTYEVPEDTNVTGKWTFTIDCGDCGDMVGPAGRFDIEDDGNDWVLEISYTYLAPKQEK